ncbi:MAG: hypothetical protein MUD01_23540 [Chloroflexaceae bacterium]|jgi:hypothetical protein|nr:hypothetical protein [Chloroflexaceae bacterium]
MTGVFDPGIVRIGIDSIGWIGAALLLFAYGLVSSKRLDGASLRYQGFNLVGSMLLTLNSAYHGAIPSVAVNVVWIIIGLSTIMRVRQLQRSKE